MNIKKELERFSASKTDLRLNDVDVKPGLG